MINGKKGGGNKMVGKNMYSKMEKGRKRPVARQQPFRKTTLFIDCYILFRRILKLTWLLLYYKALEIDIYGDSLSQFSE